MPWFERIVERPNYTEANWQNGYKFLGIIDGDTVEELVDRPPFYRHNLEAVREIECPFPRPPESLVRYRSIHWLVSNLRPGVDSFSIFVALQWNPTSQSWSHSDTRDGYGPYVDASGYTYVSPIKFPEEIPT